MKLNDPVTEFEGSLPQGTRLTFQLKSNPKMFQILSDGIYADKIMAVIRELSCNARDSNVVAGTKEPFKVNVPTSLEPNFWVEDTGLGIDPDKIVDIFWTYGASTKTNSNDTIGALGLGSKSPFAYTKSSFLVINRFNGMEYKYFCFINEAGIPDGKLMYQSPTDQPNGVRVELAVRLDDISSFRSRIIRFFSFWDQAAMPEFHGDSTVKDAILKIKAGRKIRGKGWELRVDSEVNLGQGAYAVMGGVPYPINRRSLPSVSRALDTVCNSFANITFPMGSLNFQVSREELSYDDATIRALEKSAKVVCDEILAEATKKLVGHKTMAELAVAYRSTWAELRRSFAHVAELLSAQTFSLADGRKFKAAQLTSNYVCVSKAGHTPFDVLRVRSELRDYSKGTQHFSLTTLQRVTVVKPEERDANGKLLHDAIDNTIDYFKPNLVPAPQTNPNRKRTAANYLHAGYKPTETKFETSVNSGLDTVFIINDIGERGAEGIRFYKTDLHSVKALSTAFSFGNLFFVDGFASGKTPTEIAEVREYFKDTLFEGSPVMYLSMLPNFKPPEAPKVTPKARVPAQRGTIEQRLLKVFFKKPSPKDSYTIEHVEDFEIRLDTARKAKPEYARHKLTKPLLYIETNWGNPVGPLEKAALKTETLGALKMLGLLDRFINSAVAGEEVEMHIGLLSPNQITECKDRKVELVSFKELFDAATKLMEADIELTSALKTRPADHDYDDENRTLKYMMTKKMKAVTLAALQPTNILVQLAGIHGKVQGLLKDNAQRQALMYMTFKAFNAAVRDSLAVSLAGQTNVRKLLKTYPLLESIAQMVHSSYDDALHAHLALYINSVDEAAVKAAEKARLAELAKLHAEALFEAC